jgi:SAM-dependent methyltransferase
VSGAGERYDAIGHAYARARREDPYIARQIHDALGSTGSVVNIGAGTGNYEPADREVVAVEPSMEMIAQRAGRPAPALQAVAEALPFRDGSFDVALGVITLHHWTDPVAGLREMARVARRQVVVYFEPSQTGRFWAFDYFPDSAKLPTVQDPPGEQMLAEHLDLREIRTVLLPRDCIDGFGVAFWARPEALLDPEIQAGMSWLALLPAAERARGTAKLRADVESGEWDRRHGHLRNESFFDGGYRIAIAGAGETPVTRPRSR